MDYRTTFLPQPADYLIDHVQRELSKLEHLGIPEWRNRQERDLDNRLNGIVTRKGDRAIDSVDKLEDFLKERIVAMKDKYAELEIRATAIRKFINFWSEAAFTELCCEHPRVTKELERSNPDVDIWIDSTIPMDIKVTVWPEKANPGELKLKEGLNRASAYKLIRRYYKGQGWHRWNWQNRLFIVCYDADRGDHLSLKWDFSRMRGVIFDYFDKFDPRSLHQISQEEVNGFTRDINNNGKPVQPVALADVIWNYREPPFLAQTRPTISPFESTEQLGLF